MQILPINTNYSAGQKTLSNTNFRARFSQNSIGKMASVDKDPKNPTPIPYVDIFAINQRVKEFGSKDTEIEIGEPKEEILVKEEFASKEDALKRYEQFGTFIVENEYPAYTSVLKFTNPNTPGAVGIVHLASEGKLDEKPYVTVANEVTSRIVSEGEVNLLANYVKSMTKYANNVSKTTEDILSNLSKTNFSQITINTFRKTLKP